MRFVAAAVLVGVSLAAHPVWSQPAAPGEANDTLHAPPDQPRAEAWTSDRMRAAPLLRAPVLSAPPGGPGPRPMSDASGSGDPHGLDAKARAGGTPGMAPTRWVGRLFFKKPEGDFVCAAQFISPRVILTAAHCVQDGETGKYYSDFKFALQYKDGSFSKLYGWSCLGTKRWWVMGGRHRWGWDYAMLLADAASTTGHFGWQHGWRGQYNKGTQIRLAKGIELLPATISFLVDAPTLVAMRRNKPSTPGAASGSILVANDRATGRALNHIISLTSFSYQTDPNTEYGPYFDEGFADLLKYVGRGCN